MDSTDTQRVCINPKCNNLVTSKRAATVHCGHPACRKLASRLAKGELTIRQVTCKSTGETFVTTDSRKEYVSRDVMNKAMDARKNASVRQRHHELTDHIFAIRDTADAWRFIDDQIASTDPITSRMFFADYLCNPLRNVLNVDIRKIRPDLKGKAKAAYSRKFRQNLHTAISELFCQGDTTTNTFVEVCERYCRVVYRMDLKTFRALHNRDGIVIKADNEAVEEFEAFGLPDWLLFHQPGNFVILKDYAEQSHCPEGMAKKIKDIEELTNKDNLKWMLRHAA